MGTKFPLQVPSVVILLLFSRSEAEVRNSPACLSQFSQISGPLLRVPLRAQKVAWGLRDVPERQPIWERKLTETLGRVVAGRGSGRPHPGCTTGVGLLTAWSCFLPGLWSRGSRPRLNWVGGGCGGVPSRCQRPSGRGGRGAAPCFPVNLHGRRGVLPVLLRPLIFPEGPTPAAGGELPRGPPEGPSGSQLDPPPPGRGPHLLLVPCPREAGGGPPSPRGGPSPQGPRRPRFAAAVGVHLAPPGGALPCGSPRCPPLCHPGGHSGGEFVAIARGPPQSLGPPAPLGGGTEGRAAPDSGLLGRKPSSLGLGGPPAESVRSAPPRPGAPPERTGWPGGGGPACTATLGPSARVGPQPGLGGRPAAPWRRHGGGRGPCATSSPS